MSKHLETIAVWKTKTQGGYERAILDEEHTAPPHLAHLYTYRARGCHGGPCACTGSCQVMGMFDERGHRYYTRKQKAILKKRARKSAKRFLKKFKDLNLYSKRKREC